MPSAPTESLVGTSASVVKRGSTTLTIDKVTPTFTVFTPGALEVDEWVTRAEGHETIDSVLGKFKKRLTGLRLTLQVLSGPSIDAPDLGPGQVVNSVFKIDLENAEEADVSALQVTFIVETDWLKSNAVHRWSIRLNRLSEGGSEWLSIPAHAVSVDKTSVLYSAVLPGFSELAITGSQNLSSGLPG